jgi:hypothetical protein
MSRAGAFPTPADSRAGPLARAVPPRASGAVPGSAHKSPLRMFRHSQRRSSSRSSCIQNRPVQLPAKVRPECLGTPDSGHTGVTTRAAFGAVLQLCLLSGHGG